MFGRWARRAALVVGVTALAHPLVAGVAPAAAATSAADPGLRIGMARPFGSQATPLLGPVGAVSTAAGTQAQLAYHGGPVVEHVKVVAVVWGGGTFQPEVTGTGAPSVSSLLTAITDSPHFDWMSEYDTPTQSIGRGTFAGLYTIDPAPEANGSTLDDTAIQSELLSRIAENELPAPDADTLYMLFFRQGQVITSGASSSATGFCAYHSSVPGPGSQNVRYAVIPDSASTTFCGPYAGWGNFEDSISHELVEVVTDPDVGTGDYAWYDSRGLEIADKCAYRAFGGLIGADSVRYDVTGEWSNNNQACIITQPPTEVSVGDATAIEGNSGSRVLKFPVTLSMPGQTSLTVSYHLSGGSATGGAKPGSGIDFKDSGGITKTVSFPLMGNGRTAVQKTIAVPVFGDTNPGEGDETMSVTLDSVTSGWSIARGDATGTILDDEGVAGATIATGDASVSSGMIGDRTISFPLMLSRSAGTPFTVTYTITPGTASAGTNQYFGDYSSAVTTKTITFTGSAVSKFVVVKVFGKAGYHDESEFTVTITGLSAGAPVSVLNDTGSGTITM
jgi:hypothetical protein